jgi:hypothetical protein
MLNVALLLGGSVRLGSESLLPYLSTFESCLPLPNMLISPSTTQQANFQWTIYLQNSFHGRICLEPTMEELMSLNL